MSSIIELKEHSPYWGYYKIKRRNGAYQSNNYLIYGNNIAFENKPTKKVEQELREILFNQDSSVNITI